MKICISWQRIRKIPKKYHVECESRLPDRKITIRLFEYDARIALDEGEVTEETLTVTFPNTAVLYLRTCKKTPDKMNYVTESRFLQNVGGELCRLDGQRHCLLRDLGAVMK